MQATQTTRRLDRGQIKRAALALGLLGSLAIGVATATIIRDAAETDASRAEAVTSAPATRHEVLDYTFLEQNLYLPESGRAPAAASGVDYRFLEQNLYLPAADPATAPDWSVLEENSWGHDFVFEANSAGSRYPSPDDVPQLRAGTVTY